VHPADTLGGGEPETRNQEVEIDAEIACGFDPAARRRVAKPFDTVLQTVHDPILALSGGASRHAMLNQRHRFGKEAAIHRKRQVLCVRIRRLWVRKAPAT